MSNPGFGGMINQINSYFRTIAQDKLFAWFAVLIGFFLIIIALIIW